MEFGGSTPLFSSTKGAIIHRAAPKSIDEPPRTTQWQPAVSSLWIHWSPRAAAGTAACSLWERCSPLHVPLSRCLLFKGLMAVISISTFAPVICRNWVLCTSTSAPELRLVAPCSAYFGLAAGRRVRSTSLLHTCYQHGQCQIQELEESIIAAAAHIGCTCIIPYCPIDSDHHQIVDHITFQFSDVHKKSLAVKSFDSNVHVLHVNLCLFVMRRKIKCTTLLWMHIN